MQGPPGSEFVRRRRIETDDLRPVNSARFRVCALAAAGLLLATAAVPARARAAPPSHGTLRLLVVLAQFPDRALAKQRVHFAGRRTSLVDRLIAYYDEVSAGRLHIAATVGGPVVTLPSARATYVQHPEAIARDAAIAFDASATDPADRAALADADALLVFFAGPGRESHVAGGDPGDPWSNYTTIAPPVVAAGKRFPEACVIAEREVRPFSSFGVLCHEFGHLLGLPELYAPGGAAHEGIGVWGLMGQGTWLGRGERPPHLCAWSKLRLGWADADVVERSTRGVELAAIERTPRVVKIPGDRAEEYFLVENRARIGADARLPGEGLLVWHVDERIGGFRNAESNARRKLLHLVEADGRGDLDRGHAAGGNRGDATDPWSGPPRWERLARGALALAGAVLVALAILRGMRPRRTIPVLALLAVAAAALAGAALLGRAPVCGPGTPGMAPYDGGPTRVALRNFSPAGPVMRFDVLLVAPPTAD
jgi:immune inhibitor A